MNMEHFDDDDFGELYAHVELPALTHSSPLCIEPQEDDAKNHGKDDFAPDEVKAEVENGDEEFVGSESEDDLNIVLNDEDCASFPVRNDGVGCDEDDSDEAVRVIDRGILGNNGKSGDHVADGVADHCRSGFKSQFFHHKYVRRGSALADNTKVSKHMGLVSYPSPFTKGGRSAQVRAGANQMTVQCGYRSYLPWHWSIFDVDIDALEEKPWRIPGVDITDYFNFGFDENTWKRYCVSLKQNWEEFMQTGSAVNKSPKNNLDSMKEQTEQAVSGSPLSTALGCELPKGRAIQVEESMFERQSSMDVWRPRLRDSDVVIQIKVLESSDDYSGSDNSNVRESSEEGEFCAGNKINIPRSVSEHDNDLSQEPSEDVKNSGDSSTEERKDPVAGVDKKKERQDRMDKCSEDTAEASEDESKAEEGIDLGTCSIESQLSFGDQDLSLTSYSDSESVNSVHADNEMRHQRRQLEKSPTDLKESAPSDCKIPKNSRSNRKEENMDYYSRKKGPIRQEWRPLCRNYDPGSKLHKFSEKYDVFSKPMSGVRELSLLDHEFMNYGKKSVQLQDYYGGHKRRDIPFYEETEQSYHHDDGKVVDDMVQTTYSYRDDHDRFRENTNRDLRREWDEEDYIFENRIVMKDDDREQNWYHADGGYSADEVSPLSYREPRKFMSKHWSFPAKERNMQRRRRNEMPYLRDRNSDKDNWFNECGRDFVDKSYTTSIEREVESLDSEYEHRLLEPQRSVRRERHHVRPSLELNSLWSRRIEDECQEYTSHQTSGLSYCREFYPDSQKASAYVKGVSEYLRHPGRWKHTRDVKGSDWYSNIIDDALEDEDFLFDPEKECDLGSRRYSSPSEVLDWIGDDVILRHRDGFHADEETLYYEETSWHKGTYARYESLHDEMETDDIQLQHDYLNMPRRGSDNCIKRHYKIARRDKHGQANSRSSIDFVKGDGKFHGRSSRTRSLMCGGRIENLDQGFAKKRTTMGLYKTHNDKATKFESIHNGWKRLHSVPAKKHEGPEAGEGKIVTEEPCMVDSVNRNDLPEGESLTGSKRMRTLHDENNVYQDDNKGGYDNQRIMETLAKMEKRRERFKEPIALIKEEKSLKPDDGLIVGTDETNQIRPLRKRRWGGN